MSLYRKISLGFLMIAAPCTALQAMDNGFYENNGYPFKNSYNSTTINTFPALSINVTIIVKDSKQCPPQNQPKTNNTSSHPVDALVIHATRKILDQNQELKNYQDIMEQNEKKRLEEITERDLKNKAQQDQRNQTEDIKKQIEDIKNQINIEDIKNQINQDIKNKTDQNTTNQIDQEIINQINKECLLKK